MLSGKGSMQLNFKTLVKSIAAPLVTGFASGFLARGGIKSFEAGGRPFLSPPGWVFPLAWVLLHLLAGVGAYLVRAAKPEKERGEEAVTIYNLLLFVHFLWVIFFFYFGFRIFALAWLLVVWLLAAVAAILFYSIKKPAGVLLLLFLLWTTYAGYLNLASFLLQVSGKAA